MKAFKPLSFEIEISERPKYIPGSGPPLMPISLRPPDGRDWLIHSVVTWEGVPQYLVTPPGNPAYRVPVRKELVLNWVSPRTYEDFEYLQAKEKDEEEWEKDGRIFTRTLHIKHKGFRMLQSKNAAKSRSKPEGGVIETEHSNADSDDSNNDNEEVPAMFPRNSIKRSPSTRVGLEDDREVKKSSSSLLVKESTPKRGRDVSNIDAGRELGSKRRKPSSSSQSSILEQPSLSRSRINQEHETSEEEYSETGEEDDNEKQPYQREPWTETSSGSSYPNLSQLGPANKPQQSSQRTSFQARLEAQFRRSPSSGNTQTSRILPPPRALYFKAEKQTSTGPQSSGNSSTNSKSGEFRDYPPILPPQKLTPSQQRAPSTETRTDAYVLNRADSRTPSSDPRAKDKRKSQISESINNDPAKSTTSNGLHAGTGNSSVASGGKLKSLSSKGLDKSKITPVRSCARLSEYDGTRSSLSHSVDRAPSTSLSSTRNSRRRSSQPTDLAIVVTPKKKSLADKGEDYEIFGLIDDELRKVNGVMVRYYLVNWKGDFDPSWEAEFDVSKAAIKAYKKKLLQERHAFDGAFDDPDGIPASLQKFRISNERDVAKKTETDDSYKAFDDPGDIPVSPQKFRISNEGDVAKKTEIDDANILALSPAFKTNGYYDESDGSDLQAAILLENGREEEMGSLKPMQENRQSPGQLCSA